MKYVHVPSGTEILISVATNALPRAGITVSTALYRSCPAAKALPLVGALALGLSNWTCNCCSAAAAPTDAVGCSAAMLSWLGRCEAAKGVGVAAPESVPRGRVEAWERGVGSMTFVRLGRGDDGRDGGSWIGMGVSDILSSEGWKFGCLEGR
jgi:hypothetical protein